MEGCDVVEALINGDRGVQMNAAQKLINMQAKQRHKLVERGVVSPLLLMIKPQDDEDVVGVALYALLSLAFGSERNKVNIVKSGAVPVLCEMMQSESLTLVEQSVTALMILSSCSPNKMTIAASSGAVQVLVEILDCSCYLSLQAKLDAISTLHNLSTCHNLVPILASAGAVFALVQVIWGFDKSSEVVEKAVELLENLVHTSNTALEELADTDGAMQQLVETVEEGSQQGREHAVGILLMICRSCRDKYRGLVLREGIVPGLLEVSVDGTWRAREMAKELLGILRDGSPSKSGSSVNNVLVEQMMEEIDSKGEKRAGRTLRLVEKVIAKLRA